MEASGASVEQEIVGFWPESSTPINLVECSELALLAGLSAIAATSQFKMVLTILKIDPLGQSLLKKIDLPSSNQVLGIAFEEQGSNLLIMAVNEYSLQEPERLLKSYLKLINLRSFKIETIRKDSLSISKELSKIQAFRKLEGGNQFCVSLESVIICLQLVENKFRIVQRIHGCQELGSPSRGIAFFPKKVIMVGDQYDQLHMLNFKESLYELKGENKSLVSESVQSMYGEFKKQPVGALLLHRGLCKFLESLTLRGS